MDTGIMALIVFFLAIVVAVTLAFRVLWQVAAPNEAMVISGIRQKNSSKGYKIVTGGGAFIIPSIQRVSKLNLSLREVQLQSTCYTNQGVQLVIRGVAIYKIGDGPTEISNAVQRFLGQKDEVINRNITNVLDGHLRGIVSHMTVEELITSRDVLMDKTRQVAGVEVLNLGLIIDSLQITDIQDPTNYIQSLAAPHIAAVQSNARIATAKAEQQATLQEQTSKAANAEAVRDSSIKLAQFKADTEKANAETSQAGPLALAVAEQKVTQAKTITAQLAADLAEQDLQASVRKPADAKAYATRVTAEADRDAKIANAEAEAKAVEIQGNANASAVTAEGLAKAKVIEAEKRAIAAGIEAEANALATNSEAVIAKINAQNMPENIRAAAASMDKVKNFTVFDGATGIVRTMLGFTSIVQSVMPGLASVFNKTESAKTAQSKLM